ncbi:MAG: hypothetical protein ACTSRJ_04965, partial [Candidatus Hodarchaeales archaeon]
ENKHQSLNAPIPVKIVKHTVTTKKQRKSGKRKGRPKPQSLDVIFNFPTTKRTDKKNVKTQKLGSKLSKQNKKDKLGFKSSLIKSSVKKSELISIDEISELQTDDLFTNGHKPKGISTPKQNTETEDENIVCNHCGAIISSLEVLNDGCIHCVDQFEVDD